MIWYFMQNEIQIFKLIDQSKPSFYTISWVVSESQLNVIPKLVNIDYIKKSRGFTQLLSTCLSVYILKSIILKKKKHAIFHATTIVTVSVMSLPNLHI